MNGKRNKRNPLLLLLCLCAGALFYFTQIAASLESVDANEIKTAFIFNFLKFVEWPESQSKGKISSLKMCRFGQSELAEKLGLLQGRKANDLIIEVGEISRGGSCDDCNVMFISATEGKNIEKLLTKIGNRPVLTISDAKNFAKHGGIIGLKLMDGKVRFDINLKAAEEKQLKLRSHLLKLAVEVIR